MKVYYVLKIEKAVVGGSEMYYIVKTENENEALKKVGIRDKRDEAFGFIYDIEDLSKGNDVYLLEKRLF